LAPAASRKLAIDAAWLAPPLSRGNAKGGTFREQEKKAILDALHACDGRIYGANGAAARLGLRPTTLYGKMKRLGIERAAPT